MFVQMFEEGKRERLAETMPKRFICRGSSSLRVRSVLSCDSVGVKGVYRHVIMLEGELSAPGWFAGDSVGNSDLATS